MIDQTCEGLRQQLRRELHFEHLDKQTGTLWHYTDTFGAEGILREREIRATHYSFLNDRSEMTLGHEIVRDELRKLGAAQSGDVGHVIHDCLLAEGLALTDVYADGVFVVSFCEDDGDGLSQWRAYGGGGAGYAIGFRDVEDGAQVVDNADASSMLVKLTYNEQEFRALVAKEMLFQASGIVKYCTTHRDCAKELELEGLLQMHLRAATLAVRLKHEGFKDEREWRLLIVPRRKYEKSGVPVIRHRPTLRGLVPYIPVPLSKTETIPLDGVRFGPGHDPDQGVLGLRSLLTALGYDNAEKLALRSRIPYRK
jgi:hypothetical protein